MTLCLEKCTLFGDENAHVWRKNVPFSTAAGRPINCRVLHIEIFIFRKFTLLFSLPAAVVFHIFNIGEPFKEIVSRDFNPPRTDKVILTFLRGMSFPAWVSQSYSMYIKPFPFLDTLRLLQEKLMESSWHTPM